MQFQIDSLSSIQKRIETDILTSLNDSNNDSGFFEKSLARVLSATLAPMINYLYMFIRWCSTQMFPWSATGKYLLRHSSFYGINKAFSKFASGRITVHGAPGSTIKTGAKIAANKTPFTIRHDYTIPESGTIKTEIIATNPGKKSNILESTAFTFQETIEGIQANAEYFEPITGGLDEPTDKEIQNKVRIKAQAISPTGSAADYISNALLSDGITHAWVFPRGIQKINGFVSVSIMNKNPNDTWSQPSEEQRLACYNLINTVRPDTDIFSKESGVIIPELIRVDITFSLLPGITPEILNKIEEEFRFIINNMAPGEAKNKAYEPINDTIDIENLRAALYGLRLSRFQFHLIIADYQTDNLLIKAKRNHLFYLGTITPPAS